MTVLLSCIESPARAGFPCAVGGVFKLVAAHCEISVGVGNGDGRCTQLKQVCSQHNARKIEVLGPLKGRVEETSIFSRNPPPSHTPTKS